MNAFELNALDMKASVEGKLGEELVLFVQREHRSPLEESAQTVLVSRSQN